MFTFPAIDPVALELGPIVIRWYALAYIVGLIGGWRYALLLARREPVRFEPQLLDDFVVWATLGVVIGGRLGYVLFYRPDYYITDPLQILMVWKGGMAFHGGLLGVLAATFLFARRYKVPLLSLADIVCAAAPIGLFFGRIANFINGVLMAVLIFGFNAKNRPGLLAGAFFAGYGVARCIGEFFREPDAFLGFLWFGATMGQLLSLPMILLGLYLVRRALAVEPSGDTPKRT